MPRYQFIKRVSNPASIATTVYASIDTATYTNVSVVKTTAFSTAKAGTTAVDGMTRYYDKNGAELSEVAQADIDLTASIGKYYWHLDKTLWIIVGKATYADITAARTGLGTTSILFELAIPVVTPIESVGELKAYPNGTIYTEPCIWGYMSEATKTVTTAEIPISAINKVVRYDYSTDGGLKEVDVTADVTKDATNTILTIANFVNGKTYFYDCAFAQELSTTPEMVVQVEVENGILSKDYLAGAAAWTLTANEAKAEYLIVTNAGGAANIVAPRIDGKQYTIENNTTKTITIKETSTTGVAIATGKVTTVRHNGTDFKKIMEV